MRRTLIVAGFIATLAGCSSASQNIESQQAAEQQGYNDGCKGALQNQWLPAQTTLDAMNAKDKLSYQQGWKAGFQRCVIGIGPVKINSSMPIAKEHIKPESMTEYGYDQGCKNALQGTYSIQDDFANAPKLSGTAAEYTSAWHRGYNRCRIGLGPVKLAPGLIVPNQHPNK